MKKLLLLAALGVISASALASSVQITSVGQTLEYEHENRQAGGDVSLFTDVGLKYDDWSFGIQALKSGSWNQGENRKENSRRLTSSGSRVQLSVWKKITPEFKLGYMYRGSNSYNKNYVRANYNNGTYYSNLDVAYYTPNKPAEDALNVSYRPVGISYAGVNAAVVVGYDKYKKENNLNYKLKSYLEVAFPIYSEGNFSLDSNLEIGLFDKRKYRKETAYYVYKDFGRVLAYLNATYKVDENLSLNASVGYEFRSFKYYNDKDGAKATEHKTGNKNYQDISVGWTYKF